MVGIVAGDTLGLSLSSLKSLKGLLDPGQSSLGRNGEQAYVNLATGNLVLQDYDDGLAAHGGGIAAVRTYNSQGLMSDDNGDNWSNGIFLGQVVVTGTINSANSTIVRTDRDGAKTTFTYSSVSQTYVTTQGDGSAFDSISYDRASTLGRLIFTDGSTGAREIYESGATGRLLSTIDASGNTTTYTYNGNLLTKVVDASGDTLWYDYSGNNLTQIRTTYADGSVIKTSTRVRYAYDSSNRLIQVTVDLTPDDNSTADGKVYQTNYTYDGTSNRVKTITQTDGSSQTFNYALVGSTYKVSSVTDGLGKTTSFSYQMLNSSLFLVTVNDPLGGSAQYTVSSGKLYAYAESTSSGSVSSRFDNQDSLLTGWALSGNPAVASYDANGNQIEAESGGVGVDRTFDARNQVLTETAYQRVTGPATGALTKISIGTTRYVYDGGNKNLLRFRISPEGRVTEYQYNSYGERIASIEYLGAAYNLSGLADTASPLEATMTTWVGGVDKTQQQRSEMTYDARGQLTKVTRWANVDSQGVGIADGKQSVTQYIYNQRGQLLKTIDPDIGVTQFTYDGLGRQLTITDALGRVTVSNYDDVGNKTTVTTADGVATTSNFDKTGHLISVTKTAGSINFGTTNYSYDGAGNLIMTQDPTGVRRWMMYDSVGRKVADIDAQGHVTEYSYTGIGYTGPGSELVNRVIHYANTVDTSSLVDANGIALSVQLDSIRPTASAGDLRSWVVYDGKARPVQVIDGRGMVTETSYDAAGNIASVRQYATLVDTSSLPAFPVLGNVVPSKSADDRVLRNFYDKDHLLVATLDAEGYLVEYRYDAAGHRISQIAYAAATDASQRATGTLAQLRPASGDGDNVTFYLYDHKDQLVGVIDAAGYLTESVYDGNGNVVQTIRYANKAVAPVSSTSTLAGVRPTGSALDQSASTTYDALNRVIERRDVQNTVTHYTYDTAGNVVQTSSALGTADVRTVNARYDQLGRLVGELTPQGTLALAGKSSLDDINAVWAQYGVSYGYDAAGRLITKSEQGRVTRYYYDVEGHVAFEINALGEVQEHQYNSLGQLSATVKYGTRVDVSGLTGGLVNAALTQAINAVRDPAKDGRIGYSYDAAGRVAQKTDELGNFTTYEYDAFGEVVATRQTINGQWRQATAVRYDHRGQVISSSIDPQGINASVVTRYDAFGRAVEVRDANGKSTTQQYDHLGRLVQVTDPLNAVQSSVYDAFGRVLSKTDALGNVTRYAYDDVARSVVVTTPENIVMTTIHDRFGHTTQVSDGRGNVTQYVYDVDGNLLKTVTPAGQMVNSYDSADRLVSTTDANGHVVTYSYDQVNRVLARQVDPTGLNLTTRYAYDAKGQTVQVIDPNGVVTITTFDLKGQKLSQTVDPAGLNLVTQYSYDAQGHVLTSISPGGTVTQYVYDNLGRRVEQHVDPAGLNLTTRYVYDANGNVVTRIDATGNTTRYTYDADNRQQFSIDALGNVQANVYDGAGHLTRLIRYANPLAQSAFNTLGDGATTAQVQALLQVDPANDQIEDRVYDKDGRMVASVRELGGTQGEVTRYVYDANGNVVESIGYANRIALSGWDHSTVPMPVADAAHDAHTRSVYDQLNRAIYRIDAGGGLSAFTYDAVGNIVDQVTYAKALPNGVAATPETLVAFASANSDAVHDAHVRNLYDAADRLVWSANGAGAVTRRQYDANGNLVRLTAYATPVSATASPASVAASANDRVTDTVWDAANRLVYQVDAGGNVTRTIYDQNGNALRHIAYATPISLPGASLSSAASINAVLTANTANDRVSQAAYDAAGRAVLTVNAGGAVVENAYDALGNVVQVRSYARMINPAALPVMASAADIRAVLLTDAINDRTSGKVYDSLGRLIYAVDALGYVSRNDYDGQGRVIRSVQYALAVPANTALTATALQAAVIPDSAHDRINSFSYDAFGRPLSSTDAMGKSESYGYNGLGEKISFTNKLGATWTYDYDAAGHLISETSPQVVLDAVTQDANGNLAVAAAQSVVAGVVTRMSYDALGNLIKRTEAAGRPEERSTSYEYDSLGHQVKIIYPAVAVYNASADNLSTNGATGLAARTEIVQTLYSQVTYDVFGNAVANRDVAGNMSYKAYDKLGQVSYDVDAMGYVTGYVRNAWGDTTRLTRFSLATNLTSNNPASLSAATIGAAINAVGVDHGSDRVLLNEYDALGRLAKVTEPQAYTYDSSAAAGAQYFIASKATVNTYNAFGDLVQVAVLKNAVTNSWLYTTNYYDKSSHQLATVDALGYVTTQAFDNAGNVVTHMEYAAALTSWNPQNPGVSVPLPVAGADDRKTVYVFDQNNRKISETRVAVEYSTASDGNSARGDLSTTYGYDAVGNLTRTTDASGASTYSYYDALGRVTAVASAARNGTLDGSALTPLTTFARDAYGNVVARKDYANSTAANASTYSLPTASAQDRITLTQFDRFGHAIQTTDANGVSHYTSYDAHGKVAKEWQIVTGNDGVSHTLFKAYQYDKLGQQTHIIDPASTTVLQGGLQVALVSSAPGYSDESGQLTFTGTNGVDLSWSGMINPTGGAVRVQLDYVTTSSFRVLGVDEYGSQITSGSPAQAASRTDYFSAAATAGGAAIRWNDQNSTVGGISQVSYLRVWQQDASGNWIIKWQGSPAQANGSGISTVSQAQAGLIDQATEYNAFGEVVRKGLNGGRDEYFDYDNAGHLWRTNSGDGIDKVSLYDLQGNVTASIQSAGSGNGNVNLRAYGSVDQIAVLGNVRRTDMAYDALGHVVQQAQAQRQDAVGSVSVNRSYSQAHVNSSSQPSYGEDGALTFWNGANSVSLNWNSLAGLGSGDVKVEIDYVTQSYSTHVGGGGIIGHDEAGNPIYLRDEDGNIVGSDVPVSGQVRTRSEIVTAEQGASGITMNWVDSFVSGPVAGISQVAHLRVYKKDVNGNWQAIIDQGNLGYSGNTITVAAPPDPTTSVQLQLRPAGTPGDEGWNGVSLVNFGDALRYDASVLGAGAYEYRVITTPKGGSARVSTTGSVSLSAPVLANINVPSGFGTSGYGIYAWPSPGSAVEQVLRLRAAGSNGAWQTFSVGARGNGYDGVDLTSLGAGSYEYELLWIHSGEGVPYAHGTGQITVGSAVAPVHVPAVGLPVFGPVTTGTAQVGVPVVGQDESGHDIYAHDESGNLVGGHASTVIQWPMLSTQTGATFSYRVQGSAGWTSLPITTYLTGYNESSGAIGQQLVDIAALPPGSYEFELNVVSLNDPTQSHATGNFTVYAQGAGHYETRSVPVQVPVVVTPADPSNYIVSWTGYGPTYGAPVVVGTYPNGQPILGQGYTATATYDESGYPTYSGPVTAVPYVVYHTETRTETYTEQVYVGQDPVIARDESGNIIYQTVYQTQTRVRTVPVYETRYSPRTEAYSVWTQGAPVMGSDEYGNQYQLRDESGQLLYNWYWATAYRTVYDAYQVQVGTRDETYTVQVPVQQVVYLRDEAGNIVYQARYETQTRTRQVNVQVGTTVTPPDPSNYIISAHSGSPIYGPPVVHGYDEAGNPIFQQGYGLVNGVVSAIPYTVTQTQYQDQQVWVAGTTPTPTMALTTPPYQPAYTIPGSPAVYSGGAGTPSSATAISQNAAIGAVLAQSPGATLDTGWSRPTLYQKVDRWGNVTEISDPRSAYWKTTYRYNANNQLIQQTQPDAQGGNSADSPVTRIYYDQLGRQVAVRDANGNVNGQRYDAAGNLVQELHADGGVVNYAYNAFGNKVRTIDAMGNAISYAYDKMNHLLQTARGVVGVYTVDGNNNLQWQSTRAIVESSTYDQAGRKLSQTNGNGETTSYIYDLRGNVIQTTQPLGQITRAVFDMQGRKIAEVDPDNYSSTWTYDYFGQLLSHSDLGGAVYSYTYDNARQLQTQINTRGQNQTYRYDAAGQIIRIDDNAVGQATIYAYDLAGNRVQEKTMQGGVVYQDNHMAYDALKRLRWTGDSRVTVNFTYDAVGNRTHVSTHVINSADQSQDSDRWFGYDAMNRQTLVDGYNAAGAIGAGQGHRITYDKNGNRLTDTSWGSHVSGNPGYQTITGYDEYGNPQYVTVPATYVRSMGEATEVYSYDALNRLSSVSKDGVVLDNRYYDGADRLLQTGPSGLSQDYLKALNGNSTGDGSEIKVSRFDADGHLLHQRVLSGYGSSKYDIDYTSYDQAGNVLAYNVTNHEDSNHVSAYSYALQRFEGYKPGTTYGTSQGESGTSTNVYDANGNLVAINDSTKPANNRSFVNDISGHALYVNQGGNVERQLVVNGEVLGRYGSAVNPDNPVDQNGNPVFIGINEFNFGYQSINGDYPSASPGMVVVAPNDTLQSIARGAYGDSQLWYVIAEANGLASNADLRVGQTLTVPNRVNTIHNDSATFKPYDPSKIIGSTTPNIPAPAADDDGCAAASIIITVIVIVVAVISQQYYLANYGIAEGTAGTYAMGTASSEAVAATATTGATWTTESAVVSGMIGGAAGAVAGQLVANLVGLQKGFDWNAVALSAIGGGVSAGVGGVKFSDVAVLNSAARSAVANALTQGIAVATGLQQKFNWTGVVASAASAGIATGLGDGLGLNAKGVDSTSPSEMLKSTFSGMVTRISSTVISGGKVDIGGIAVDAFGNALGSSLADQMQQGSQQSPYSLAAGMTPSQGFRVSGGEGLMLGSGANVLGNSAADQISQAGQQTVVQYSAEEQAQDFAREQNRGSWQKTAETPNGRVFGNTNTLEAGVFDNGQDPYAVGVHDSAGAMDALRKAAGIAKKYIGESKEGLERAEQYMMAQAEKVKNQWDRMTTPTQADLQNLVKLGQNADSIGEDFNPPASLGKTLEQIAVENYGMVRAATSREGWSAIGQAGMNYLQPFNQTPLTGEQRAAGTDTFLATLGIVVKETEPLFLFAGAPSSEVRISGANRLPLSFEDSLVVRGDASRAQIVQTIGDAAQPSLESILRLDPNARIGFRGSLVDGLKNETKLGMNGERVAFDGIVATKNGKPYTGPQGYDADFFVVSDELAAQFSKKTFFRDIAKLDGALKGTFQEFGNAMQRNPILGGMKTELPSFRVYTTAEMAKKSGSQYYFLQVGK